MGWQTIPNVNITTDKGVQATIYIRMLFEYFKIMASIYERRREGKGGTPKGWFAPMFEIMKNALAECNV